MKSKIYIMIRYSILAKSRSAWVIGRDVSDDEYREKLFSESRLNMHEFLFSNVTLPSIEAANKPIEVEVLIFTSVFLPQKYMERLKGIVNQYSWARLITLDDSDRAARMMDQHLLKEVRKDGQSKVFSTVRLDDDDALSKNYFENLAKYTDDKYLGFAVSFHKGLKGRFEGDTYSNFEVANYPKCAQGLAFVSKYEGGEHTPPDLSIYSLGNHTKIDEKHPVILDASFVSYIRTMHVESDIFRKGKHDKVSRKESLELAKIADTEFGVNPQLLSHLRLD